MCVHVCVSHLCVSMYMCVVCECVCVREEERKTEGGREGGETFRPSPIQKLSNSEEQARCGKPRGRNPPLPQ